MFKSSPPEVFSRKDTIPIRSESTGEQTHRSGIPIKPLCNFIEITLMHECAPENPRNTRKTTLPGRT